jgi:adenylate kinase family enzyme
MDISEILKTEFSEDFVQKMKNRMVVSFCKYGPITDGYPKNVDAVASLKLRLDKYKETGNTEFLCDVANFAMIEFMLPRHSDAHFKGTDSHESPGRIGHIDKDPSQKTNARHKGERWAEEGVD